MSFKFDLQDQKYWAKQMRDQTIVYLLNDRHMPSQFAVLIEGKADRDSVIKALNYTTTFVPSDIAEVPLSHPA